MALRDNNRFRKIYPFIRRKPSTGGSNVVFESGKKVVTGTDTATISFSTNFTSAPFVTATAFDSDSNNTANVNTFIVSVTTTQVVIGFSSAFNGEVHYHAIQAA